jgi:uncharacterized membrane protein YjfL (UPF0719 family)
MHPAVLPAVALFADDAVVHWYPDTFVMAIVSAVVFGLVGIVLALFGFKLFDWLTPGNLAEEILQKQNLAAAILAGAFILGICIIVAMVVS